MSTTCLERSGDASLSSSTPKLIDYTKNRERFVGDRRRKRTSMCSDFQTTIDRAISRTTEEEEEVASTSTVGSSDLVVFYLRRRFRQAADVDEPHVDGGSNHGCEPHAVETEEDHISYVSESETPSEGAHFGYLPGAIRNNADPFSPRPHRASLSKTVEDDEESTRSFGSYTDKDHSSSYCSDSECSTQNTSTASHGNSSIRSLSLRSVRSNESFQLGLLGNGFIKKSIRSSDDSQSSVEGSFLNCEENKSIRSACSRSATGRSLDSLAPSLLQTPTSNCRAKRHINPSLSGGYPIRSNHVHTPSSVKKSKYLLAFASSDGDPDGSQRSARSAGNTRSGRRGDRTISLKDFFRKEEVKRLNPDTKKQSMNIFTPKTNSLNKPKFSEVTPRKKRADSDVSAPETPVTASMTSQTMSTPSGRGGLLRSFSFSDKGNSIIAELNQTLKRGLLCDLNDDEDCGDDASVANSEALASLMDGLRNTSKSNRALDSSFHDSSSRLDDAPSANHAPYLFKMQSDSYSSESDDAERMLKATTYEKRWVAQTPKYTDRKTTMVDQADALNKTLSHNENTCDLFAGRDPEKRLTSSCEDNMESEKRIASVKATGPTAGFLIQPKALPLRKLPKGTLPFALLDCRVNA